MKTGIALERSYVAANRKLNMARSEKPPRIMGIVNVTPDSFSDGGEHESVDAAVAYGRQLVEDGADILDIGGESTRPGAGAVPVQQEMDRVIPVIERLVKQVAAPISIDTRKPEVAKAAVNAGATIWNDVSALTFSGASLETAASLGCGVILMHAQGNPETMQDNPQYDNVVDDVCSYLQQRADDCLAAGIAREKIMIDPGIGFGKTVKHNLLLLKNIGRFSALAPVLVGASRKRFIAAVDRDCAETGRIGGSLAAAIMAVQQGAKAVRVHDVAPTRQALAVLCAAEAASNNP